MLYTENENMKPAAGILNGLFLAIGFWSIFAAIFFITIPRAMEKELHRQEVVRQYHCQQYADDIASWAKHKGIENPCTQSN